MTRKRWWEVLAALALLVAIAATTYGFILSKKRDEALLRAVAADHHEQVVDLLGEGANPSTRNSARETPLLIAARRGNEAIVLALLEAGANPNQADQYGATPLWWVAARDGQMPNRVRMAQLLLARGAEVNLSPRLNGGIPPLTWAAAKGNARMVKLLLRHGANPTFVASYGQTALKAARQSLHTQIARVTRTRQAGVREAHLSHLIPQHMARMQEAAETVRLLEHAGAVR